MAEQRVINDEYRQIGEELIETEPELAYIKNSDVKIVYLSSDQAKKNSRERLVCGECEKISGKYKWGIPCDFTITVFEPNVEHFSEEQMRILIFHELLHVGIGDKEGNFYCRPHDLEDFKLIIDRFGTNWGE